MTVEADAPKPEGDATSYYIRTRAGAVGPYSLEALRRMGEAGVLPPAGAVSLDKRTWRRADRIAGLHLHPQPVLEGERPPAESGDESGYQPAAKLRGLVDRLCRRSWVPQLVNQTGIVTMCAGVVATVVLLAVWASGVGEMLTFRRMVLFAALAVPGILGGLAVLGVLGDLLLRWAFGLTDAERRFAALHLPHRALERFAWGRPLHNWLQRGDLLLSPTLESPEASLHVFRRGEPLRSIEEEVAFWESLHYALPCRLRALGGPGGTVRQVQTVGRLPRWSQALEEVTDGFELAALLDDSYGEWAGGMLERARKRLGLPPGTPRAFFLVHLDLGAAGELLVVCIHPQPGLVEESPEQTDAIADTHAA